jgi:hypothetical protein
MKSYLEKAAVKGEAKFARMKGWQDLSEYGSQYVLEEGIPKEFLKKVHK